MQTSKQQKPKVGMRVVFDLTRSTRREPPRRQVGYGTVVALIPAGKPGRPFWFGDAFGAEQARRPKKVDRFVVKKENGHYIVGAVHMFDRNVHGSFVGPLTLR